MVQALGLLLGCQLVGEWLGWAFALPVPGPVLGLVLLWALLLLRPGLVPRLQGTAQGLLSHLSLLFVPAGVGIVNHLGRIGQEAWAIALALLVSTVVGLFASAQVTAWLLRNDKDSSP
jgi:putative effector of murein hydrolase LrgA (UPF0299 family)